MGIHGWYSLALGLVSALLLDSEEVFELDCNIINEMPKNIAELLVDVAQILNAHQILEKFKGCAGVRPRMPRNEIRDYLISESKKLSRDVHITIRAKPIVEMFVEAIRSGNYEQAGKYYSLIMLNKI